jgi:hypothetical protein
MLVVGDIDDSADMWRRTNLVRHIFYGSVEPFPLRSRPLSGGWMSAFEPETDFGQTLRHVRKVPTGDITHLA